MKEQQILQSYAKEILELKAQEEMMKARRYMLETRIGKMVATADEGTDKAEAGRYRITITSKLIRTLDYETYLTLEAQIPETLRPVRMKPEIDLKVLRAMDMAKPGFSAQFITTKPAKPYVKIEEAQK